MKTMNVNQARPFLAAVVVAGLMVALVAALAPWLSLGRAEDFVLFKWIGLSRREMLIGGLAIAALPIAVLIATIVDAEAGTVGIPKCKFVQVTL